MTKSEECEWGHGERCIGCEIRGQERLVRLLARWVRDMDRASPSRTFTSGPARTIAYWIFHAERDNLDTISRLYWEEEKR